MSAVPDNVLTIESANAQGDASIQNRSDQAGAETPAKVSTASPTPPTADRPAQIISFAANAATADGGGKEMPAAATDDSEPRKEYEECFLCALNQLVTAEKASAGPNRSMSTGQPTILARLVNLSRKLSELDDARPL